MSKKEKLLERLKTKPKDFTYDELKTLLKHLGFIEDYKGKTSGSRVVFYNRDANSKVEVHKPHPQNVMKGYAIDNVLDVLKEIGVIKDE